MRRLFKAYPDRDVWFREVVHMRVMWSEGKILIFVFAHNL